MWNRAVAEIADKRAALHLQVTGQQLQPRAIGKLTCAGSDELGPQLPVLVQHAQELADVAQVALRELLGTLRGADTSGTAVLRRPAGVIGLGAPEHRKETGQTPGGLARQAGVRWPA